MSGMDINTEERKTDIQYRQNTVLPSELEHIENQSRSVEEMEWTIESQSRSVEGMEWTPEYDNWEELNLLTEVDTTSSSRHPSLPSSIRDTLLPSTSNASSSLFNVNLSNSDTIQASFFNDKTQPCFSKEHTAEKISRTSLSSPDKDNKEDKSVSAEVRCSICLDDVEDSSNPENCNHLFCFKCIVDWAKIKAVCPLCKKEFSKVKHKVGSSEELFPIPNLPRTDESENNNGLILDSLFMQLMLRLSSNELTFNNGNNTLTFTRLGEDAWSHSPPFSLSPVSPSSPSPFEPTSPQYDYDPVSPTSPQYDPTADYFHDDDSDSSLSNLDADDLFLRPALNDIHSVLSSDDSDVEIVSTVSKQTKPSGFSESSFNNDCPLSSSDDSDIEVLSVTKQPKPSFNDNYTVLISDDSDEEVKSNTKQPGPSEVNTPFSNLTQFHSLKRNRGESSRFLSKKHHKPHNFQNVPVSTAMSNYASSSRYAPVDLGFFSGSFGHIERPNVPLNDSTPSTLNRKNSTRLQKSNCDKVSSSGATERFSSDPYPLPRSRSNRNTLNGTEIRHPSYSHHRYENYSNRLVDLSNNVEQCPLTSSRDPLVSQSIDRRFITDRNDSQTVTCVPQTNYCRPNYGISSIPSARVSSSSVDHNVLGNCTTGENYLNKPQPNFGSYNNTLMYPYNYPSYSSAWSGVNFGPYSNTMVNPYNCPPYCSAYGVGFSNVSPQDNLSSSYMNVCSSSHEASQSANKTSNTSALISKSTFGRSGENVPSTSQDKGEVEYVPSGSVTNSQLNFSVRNKPGSSASDGGNSSNITCKNQLKSSNSPSPNYAHCPNLPKATLTSTNGDETLSQSDALINDLEELSTKTDTILECLKRAHSIADNKLFVEQLLKLKDVIS